MANERGFVAYGLSFSMGTTDSPFNFDLAVWFSANGHDWSEIALEEFSNSSAAAGAATANQFVIVGTHDSRPASWISDDGMAWQMHSIELAEDDRVTMVASDGEHFLAIGTHGSGAADVPPAAWASSDGIAWREVTAPDVEQLTAVTAGADGFLVLGSERDELFIHEKYSAWLLTDERTFERAGEFVDQVCCTPQALAASDAAYVAVGAGDCDDGLIGAGWHLGANGPEWQRAAHSADLDESILWSVAATSEGFMAAGGVGREFSASRVGVWTSVDGMAWQLRSLLTDRRTWLVGGIAANELGTVVIGQNFADPLSERSVTDDSVIVWFLPAGSSPGEEVRAGPPETSGCDSPRAGTGWSADELEGNFDSTIPVRFKTVQLDGEPVRRGMNPTGTVEVLLFGDPTDIERIEVRGRNTETEGGATSFAVYWLLDDAWFNKMFDVEEGVTDHAEGVVAGLFVTFDRIEEGPWQFKFVGVPAPTDD